MIRKPLWSTVKMREMFCHSAMATIIQSAKSKRLSTYFSIKSVARRKAYVVIGTDWVLGSVSKARRQAIGWRSFLDKTANMKPVSSNAVTEFHPDKVLVSNHCGYQTLSLKFLQPIQNRRVHLLQQYPLNQLTNLPVYLLFLLAIYRPKTVGEKVLLWVAQLGNPLQSQAQIPEVIEWN